MKFRPLHDRVAVRRVEEIAGVLHLEMDLVQGPSLAQVLELRDPRNEPLDSHAEAGVRHAAEPPEIEVPPVGLGVETLLAQLYFDPHPKELMLRNHA